MPCDGHGLWCTLTVGVVYNGQGLWWPGLAGCCAVGVAYVVGVVCGGSKCFGGMGVVCGVIGL